MSVKLRFKKLNEGEVPQQNQQPQGNQNQENQNQENQQSNFNAEEALKSINAYYSQLFDGIKPLCNGEAVIKVIPSLKDANDNAQSPLNASAKAVSDAIAAFQKIDAKDTTKFSELLTSLSNIISKINDYAKAIINMNQPQQNTNQQTQQNTNQQNNGQQPQQNTTVNQQPQNQQVAQ